jgi:hypothetical protein
LDENIPDFVDEVVEKQAKPLEYLQVILTSIEVKQIRKIRKIVNKIISVFKDEEFHNESKAFY